MTHTKKLSIIYNQLLTWYQEFKIPHQGNPVQEKGNVRIT